MNIAIIDDDIKFTELFKKILNEDTHLKNETISFYCFTNPDDFVEEYKQLSQNTNSPDVSRQFDIIFMDICFDETKGVLDQTGIDAAINSIKNPATEQLVFISNFDSNVFNSLKAQPAYFIRKSNLTVDLANALDVCLKRISINNADVVLNGDKEVLSSPVSNVLYIESQRKNMEVHFLDGSYKAIKITLTQCEEQIKSPVFLKVHRSYLVNCQYITNIQKFQVTLTDGTVIPISKYRYQQVHEEFLMKMATL